MKFRLIHPRSFENFGAELGVVGDGGIHTREVDALGFNSRVRGGDNVVVDDYRELPIENHRVELGDMIFDLTNYNTHGLAGGTVLIRYGSQQPIPILVKYDPVPGQPYHGQTYLQFQGRSIQFDHVDFDFRENSRDLLGMTYYFKGKPVAKLGMNGQTRWIPLSAAPAAEGGAAPRSGNE